MGYNEGGHGKSEWGIFVLIIHDMIFHRESLEYNENSLESRSGLMSNRRVSFIIGEIHPTKMQERKPTTYDLFNMIEYLVDHNVPKFETIIENDLVFYVKHFPKPFV